MIRLLQNLQSWTKIVGTLVQNSPFFRYSISILPFPPFNVVLLWTRRVNCIAYHVWLQHWFRGVGCVKCPSFNGQDCRFCSNLYYFLKKKKIVQRTVIITIRKKKKKKKTLLQRTPIIRTPPKITSYNLSEPTHWAWTMCDLPVQKTKKQTKKKQRNSCRELLL